MRGKDITLGQEYMTQGRSSWDSPVRVRITKIGSKPWSYMDKTVGSGNKTHASGVMLDADGAEVMEGDPRYSWSDQKNHPEVPSNVVLPLGDIKMLWADHAAEEADLKVRQDAYKTKQDALTAEATQIAADAGLTLSTDSWEDVVVTVTSYGSIPSWTLNSGNLNGTYTDVEDAKAAVVAAYAVLAAVEAFDKIGKE